MRVLAEENKKGLDVRWNDGRHEAVSKRKKERVKGRTGVLG